MSATDATGDTAVDDADVSIPSFTIGGSVWSDHASTTFTAVVSAEILTMGDRDVINRMRAAVDLIEALAPDNVIGDSGPGNAAAHQAIAEELSACFEALQKWQAQRMRAEVKEGGG